MQSLTMNDQGIVQEALWIPSPNVDDRPTFSIESHANHQPEISLIVVHNISLPPNEFGGNGIIELFSNTLNPAAHPYYADIYTRHVSAHFLIRRDGQLVQFASCLKRAWHAGASNWQGRERCNDFSVGIEVEGSDFVPFESAQYLKLNALIALLKQTFAIQAVVGHSDIAPGRKTDPGPYFEWDKITP
jgi:N-acetyl-anhydromuramoyl-L-alanine amidase